MLERLVTTLPVRKVLTDRIASRAWNTPQVGIILGVLLLLYFLMSFIGLFFYEEQLPQARLVATLLIYIATVILIAHVNRQRGGSWANNFGMGSRHLKKLVLSPVLYLAFIPFLILAARVWHLFLQDVLGLEIELQKVAQVIVQDLSWLQILYILTAVFIAPFFEEIMFSGMVFPYLVKHAGLAKGTVLVSLLFATMHFHLPSFLPLFLLSAVLCLAYWRTGSLWVGIGMHAIFNTVSILALNFVG